MGPGRADRTVAYVGSDADAATIASNGLIPYPVHTPFKCMDAFTRDRFLRLLDAVIWTITGRPEIVRAFHQGLGIGT